MPRTVSKARRSSGIRVMLTPEERRELDRLVRVSSEEGASQLIRRLLRDEAERVRRER